MPQDTKQTYFHMEAGCEDRFSLTFGPFEFVQLTYSELRIGPDGDVVGMFKNGRWMFIDDERTRRLLGEGKMAFGGEPGTLSDSYTDVVIFGK